jgi:hypothetical protein
MATPTEHAGDEIDAETVRSGDDDPIPSQFVADSFSQVPDTARAPRNIYGLAGRGLEVGGGVGGGLRGPSPTLCVGLTRGNSLGRGTTVGGAGRGPGAAGRGLGLGTTSPASVASAGEPWARHRLGHWMFALVLAPLIWFRTLLLLVFGGCCSGF